jgi:flagellin-like protein
VSDFDFRGLLTDDEAVSSVIGVVLMVAVTIVLAASIGVFVLGIGTGLTDPTPQATLSMSSSVGGTAGADYVNVSSEGGESFAAEDTYLTVAGTKAWEGGSGAVGANYRVGASKWDGDVEAGSRLDIVEDGADSIRDGDEVQVIWSTGDSSSILYTGTA